MGNFEKLSHHRDAEAQRRKARMEDGGSKMAKNGARNLFPSSIFYPHLLRVSAPRR
jgi:hypothetical protein